MVCLVLENWHFHLKKLLHAPTVALYETRVTTCGDDIYNEMLLPNEIETEEVLLQKRVISKELGTLDVNNKFTQRLPRASAAW